MLSLKSERDRERERGKSPVPTLEHSRKDKKYHLTYYRFCMSSESLSFWETENTANTTGVGVVAHI